MTVSRYNQQALAATAMIQKDIKEQVGFLKQELPKEDIIVKVGVTREGADGNLIDEVAVIHMDYSSGATIRLKTCVYKEEHVRQKSIAHLSSSSSSSSTTTSLVKHADGSVELPAPVTFHLSSPKQITNFKKDQDIKSRIPDALKVISVIDKVFPQGIPIPGENVIDVYYRVSVNKTAEKAIQAIFYHSQGERYAVDDAVLNGFRHRDFSNFLSQHIILTQIAAGQIVPGAEGSKVTSMTGSYHITDATSKSKIKVEETKK